MWPRVVEVMLGCWLAMSPFVFGHDPAHDLAMAIVIVSLALISFFRPLGNAHLLIGLISLWLIGYGLTFSHPAPPSAQNHILLGLLFLMFAIIPNNANSSPPTVGAVSHRAQS